MRHSSLPFWGVLVLCSALVACAAKKEDGDGGTSGDGGASGEGGILGDGGVLGDGGSVDGAATDARIVVLDDGAIIVIDSDSGIVELDGGGICFPATCAGRTYACGDCMDNDDDGLIDAEDPGCIGACDNSENIYGLAIPGGDTPNCRRDCYFDDDQGAGNDGCAWDSRCDPLSPDAPTCNYDPSGGGVSCVEEQSSTCMDTCRPLVPNGCDCFGCCELPGGSGNFVFLGSTPEAGVARCGPETVDNPDSCRACTPLEACFNPCGYCELCLGKTTLPPECLGEPPVDAGVPGDGGSVDDGGPSDAGVGDGGGLRDAFVPQRCDPGVQACGLITDPRCPAGWYCLTGCCAQDILL